MAQFRKDYTNKFILKCGRKYYGIINCLGDNVLVTTECLTHATLFYEPELASTMKVLAKKGISVKSVPYLIERKQHIELLKQTANNKQIDRSGILSRIRKPRLTN